MVEPRGEWLVSQGIAKRWQAEGLDAAIRAYWTEDASAYEPLNDTEARPETPFPYVVLEIAPPDITARSASATEQEHYEDIQVQFTVHAQTTDTQHWREISREVASLVLAAFDPGTNKLDIAPDNHLCTIPQSNFAARNGDSEGARVIEYIIRIEGVYDWGAGKA